MLDLEDKGMVVSDEDNFQARTHQVTQAKLENSTGLASTEAKRVRDKQS